MRERPVREEDLAFFGPVIVAVLLDIGWLRAWPWTITEAGMRAARAGTFTREKLPAPYDQQVTVRPSGAYHWEGRLA